MFSDICKSWTGRPWSWKHCNARHVQSGYHYENLTLFSFPSMGDNWLGVFHVFENKQVNEKGQQEIHCYKFRRYQSDIAVYAATSGQEIEPNFVFCRKKKKKEKNVSNCLETDWWSTQLELSCALPKDTHNIQKARPRNFVLVLKLFCEIYRQKEEGEFCFCVKDV